MCGLHPCTGFFYHDSFPSPPLSSRCMTLPPRKHRVSASSHVAVLLLRSIPCCCQLEVDSSSLMFRMPQQREVRTTPAPIRGIYGLRFSSLWLNISRHYRRCVGPTPYHSFQMEYPFPIPDKSSSFSEVSARSESRGQVWMETELMERCMISCQKW